MQVELRRIIHDDHFTFHYELILIPNNREARTIDGFIHEQGKPKPEQFPFPVTGDIRIADDFSLYIRLTERRKYATEQARKEARQQGPRNAMRNHSPLPKRRT